MLQLTLASQYGVSINRTEGIWLASNTTFLITSGDNFKEDSAQSLWGSCTVFHLLHFHKYATCTYAICIDIHKERQRSLPAAVKLRN